MSDHSSNATTTNQQYGNRIEPILHWANQHKGSWDIVFRSLWSEVEELNSNPYLAEELQKVSETGVSSLFTNQEQIIQLLEEQPFDWHNQEKYINLYEQTLGELLSYHTAGPLMKFLATIRVGVRKNFYDSITNRLSDQEQILELQLLCVLRSQQLLDTEALSSWTTLAEETIQAYHDSADEDNWQRAIYTLPILGLLMYRNKPRNFLEHCRDISFGVQSITQFPKLTRHLQLYYRNAVLKLCKQKSWKVLAELKKHNTSWAADFFTASFQAPSMSGYDDQLNKWEKNQVTEQLTKHDSILTEKMIDDLVKINKEK